MEHNAGMLRVQHRCITGQADRAPFALPTCGPARWRQAAAPVQTVRALIVVVRPEVNPREGPSLRLSQHRVQDGSADPLAPPLRNDEQVAQEPTAGNDRTGLALATQRLGRRHPHHPTDTDLEGRWEQRLGLRPGEFFQRLRQSGLGREANLGRDANLGRVSEAEFAQALGRLYGLAQPTTDELLVDLWDWYVGELNTELADYFQRLRPRYRTAILSNAAAGGRREEERRYGFAAMADVLVYSYEVGIEKPDRRIYKITCQRLGVAPGEVVFLDDLEPMWWPPGGSGCGRYCSRAPPRRSPTSRHALRSPQAEPM
jgi:FMN phosphatase YigB (HAD superfamily)